MVLGGQAFGSCLGHEGGAIINGTQSAGGGGGQRTKCGQELPHVQGQGQQPRVPGCDGAGTAERSCPMSEVRGEGREEIQRRYPTPEARDGSGRSHPASKVRDSGLECQAAPAQE